MYGFFDMFAWITQVQNRYILFIFLFNETEMAQNGPKLRMTWTKWKFWNHAKLHGKKTFNLKGVSTSFWPPYFCNYPFCGRLCCKTSICISCFCWFICTNPMMLSAFTFPPFVSRTGEQSFWLLLNRWLLGFHPSALLPCSANL